MNVEIKPCPFCESRESQVVDGFSLFPSPKTHEQEEFQCHYIRCTECGCEGRKIPYGSEFERTRLMAFELASQAWNNRPSPWRDIADAPKDKTSVALLFKTPVVRQYELGLDEIELMKGVVVEGVYCLGHWYDLNGNGFEEQPVKWMPIPPTRGEQ